MDEKKSAKKDKTKEGTKEGKASKPSTPIAPKKKKETTAATKDTTTKKPKADKDTPSKPSTPATTKKSASAPSTPKIKKEPSSKKLKGEKKEKDPAPPAAKTPKTTKKAAVGTTTPKVTKKPKIEGAKVKPPPEEEDQNNHSESEQDSSPETAPSPTPPQGSPLTNSTTPNPSNDTNHVAASEDAKSDDDRASLKSSTDNHHITISSTDHQDLDVPIHESDLSNNIEDVRLRLSKLLNDCHDNVSLLLDLHKDMTDYLKAKGISVAPPTPTMTATPTTGATSLANSSNSVGVLDSLSDAAIAEKRAAMSPTLSLSVDSAALAATYASGGGVDSAVILSGLSAQEKAALRVKALQRIKAIKERVGPENDRATTPDPLRGATPEPNGQPWSWSVSTINRQPFAYIHLPMMNAH